MLLTLLRWLTSPVKKFGEPLTAILPWRHQKTLIRCPKQLVDEDVGSSLWNFHHLFTFPDPRTHRRGLPPELMFISVQFVIQFTHIQHRKWPEKGPRRRRHGNSIVMRRDFVVVGWGWNGYFWNVKIVRECVLIFVKTGEGLSGCACNFVCKIFCKEIFKEFKIE